MNIQELIPMLGEDSATYVTLDEVAMFSELIIDFREQITGYLDINNDTFRDLIDNNQLSRQELITIIQNLQ